MPKELQERHFNRNGSLGPWQRTSNVAGRKELVERFIASFERPGDTVTVTVKWDDESGRDYRMVERAPTAEEKLARIQAILDNVHCDQTDKIREILDGG